jgi:hypothetical protein
MNVLMVLWFLTFDPETFATRTAQAVSAPMSQEDCIVRQQELEVGLMSAGANHGAGYACFPSGVSP